jgi:exopolyphosphatase/guanosine-5'-triphosphate,3'-diphosphate pyrophosphatase
MHEEAPEGLDPAREVAHGHARRGRRPYYGHHGGPPADGRRHRTYAALDLGTNNCRLLLARPDGNGFRVVDAFSRIIRLGEGISLSGRISEAAIARAVAALAICRDKMHHGRVSRARLIATEACRAAENGDEFCARISEEVGLDLEIVDRETEARLAATGCTSLIDPEADSVILFDIGGGSSELVRLGHSKPAHGGRPQEGRPQEGRPQEGRPQEGQPQEGQPQESRPHDGPPDPVIEAWVSLPFGVVTLAERHGGVRVTPDLFETMVAEVLPPIAAFAAQNGGGLGHMHLLGTSGTVTTVAGVHLGLLRYERRRVDGCWLTTAEITAVIERLVGMSFEARVANACIGADRADLVLAGCAILEAIRRAFPCERLRVADRGLREGMLVEMMRADGVWGGAAQGTSPS